MHRTRKACFTAAALVAVTSAVFAGPADLMPTPLDGWTAGKVSVNEIDRNATARLEITRDYTREVGGLRIVLKTHDRAGANLIAYVNDVQQKDPDKAQQLADKGIRPFVFESHEGVVQAAEGGNMSGAALRVGEAGTLTLEGLLDGRLATVAPDHIKAYLRRIDLERMSAFVERANDARRR